MTKMIARALLSLLLAVGILISARAQQKAVNPEKAKMDIYITNLMSKMTLDEKIGQLNLPSIGFDITGPLVSVDVDKKIKNGMVGGVFNTFTPEAVRKLQDMAVKETRLKIPLLFGYDVIHGHKTIFPIPLALACTWDMNLVEQSARVAAQEASADGLCWTFSPMVDISRDPRWGRSAEGSGEDPWLGSQIARAMVKGYQGDDLSKPNTIMACVKHFALYGGAEAGRDYNTVDMSMVKMYNDYLPPYKAAFDAGAGSAMSSFNEINGVPATANKWLMTDLLRGQWGFKGMVCTDYTAVNELIEHGIGKDLKDVSRLALNAGIDMDMVGEGFILYARELVKEGKVTQKTIDDACRRILEAKYKLGLFDDPYRYINESRPAKEILTPANRKIAKEIAEQSMVLLKNDNQLLPLKPQGTIALIGPLADNQREMIGTWSGAGDWQRSITVRSGIRNLFGENPVLLTAKGCNLLTDRKYLAEISGDKSVDPRTDDEMIKEAVETAGKADVVVAVLGEPSGLSGEAASRSDIGLPGRQLDLLKALVATGKPVVLVLMNGRPLTLEWENEHVPAILEAWHPGTEAGDAVASILFGIRNPAGKLTMTFPRNVGQIPIYYNHKHTGRPYAGNPDDKYKSRYLDVSNDPLYPFGYGLSYTTFNYSDLKLDKSTMNMNGTLKVSVTLTNTGKVDGAEVAQLYIHDLVGSITRPVKELKGYQKVFLKAGESKTLTFALTSEDLAFYNEKLEHKAEPGMFIVFVGGSSDKGLEASFELTK
ncbi:MAG: beta-glucosidase BglX [Bacteroidetes bacterium]|nr:beta-glucosidase BglX [Bacteroidota bacterium]